MQFKCNILLYSEVLLLLNNKEIFGIRKIKYPAKDDLIGCWGALFEISEELILAEFLSLKDLMSVSSEGHTQINRSRNVTNIQYYSNVDLVLDGQDLLKKNLTVRQALTDHYKYVSQM